jgi:hypothetical protein
MIDYDCSRAWEWLNVTLRFGLKRAEEVCIEVMGADMAVKRSRGVDYERLLKELPLRAILRVMESMSQHMVKLNDTLHKKQREVERLEDELGGNESDASDWC